MDFHVTVYECETQDNDPPLTDKDATQSLNSDGPRHSHDVIITDNQFHLLRAGLKQEDKVFADGDYRRSHAANIRTNVLTRIVVGFARTA